MSTRNTVKIATTCPFRKEALAGGAITPGHLLQRSGTTFVVHASDGENPRLALVAEENDFEGQDLTDAYASGDRVFARVYQPGDIFNGLLAIGESVALNGECISAGDGTVRAVTGVEVGNFMAREVVDNSASSVTAAARIELEVVTQ